MAELTGIKVYTESQSEVANGGRQFWPPFLWILDMILQNCWLLYIIFLINIFAI